MQKEGKSAILAVILSLLWPGVGQLYLGSIGKGMAFLLIDIFGWFLNFTIIGLLLGIPIIIVMPIWAAIDANMVAKAT